VAIQKRAMWLSHDTSADDLVSLIGWPCTNPGWRAPFWTTHGFWRSRQTEARNLNSRWRCQRRLWGEVAGRSFAVSTTTIRDEDESLENHWSKRSSLEVPVETGPHDPICQGDPCCISAPLADWQSCSRRACRRTVRTALVVLATHQTGSSCWPRRGRVALATWRAKCCGGTGKVASRARDRWSRQRGRSGADTPQQTAATFCWSGDMMSCTV
jgi:hypothetical protein